MYLAATDSTVQTQRSPHLHQALFDGAEPLCNHTLANCHSLNDGLDDTFYKNISTSCSRFDAGALTVFSSDRRKTDYYTRSICVISQIVNKDANLKAKNWFDRVYYPINFVAQIIDTYVTRSRTFYKGQTVQPLIPMYGKNGNDNTTIVNDIVKQLTGKTQSNDNLTPGRVEAVLYAMKLGYEHNVVHPAVYRPEQNNAEQNSPGAEQYLAGQKEAEDKECTYFGVNVCAIGTGVKYTVFGLLGVAAVVGGIKVYKTVKTVKGAVA